MSEPTIVALLRPYERIELRVENSSPFYVRLVLVPQESALPENVSYPTPGIAIVIADERAEPPRAGEGGGG